MIRDLLPAIGVLALLLLVGAAAAYASHVIDKANARADRNAGAGYVDRANAARARGRSS